jgi:hypothetical protein
MVCNENVLAAFIMRGIENISMMDADKEEPAITPEHAGPVNEIAAIDLSEERTEQHEWEHKKHHCDKHHERVNAIQQTKGEHQPLHGTGKIINCSYTAILFQGRCRLPVQPAIFQELLLSLLSGRPG